MPLVPMHRAGLRAEVHPAMVADYASHGWQPVDQPAAPAEPAEPAEPAATDLIGLPALDVVRIAQLAQLGIATRDHLRAALASRPADLLALPRVGRQTLATWRTALGC